MATDPVCGMTVDEQTAAGSAEYEGERYYFCSTHCLHKFQAAPEHYTRPPATSAVPPAVYTCPMHPEIRQDAPGTCPKCGMALEPLVPPAPPAPATTATEYVCPMHPEIVRSDPGNCPKCGMALEPRTVSLEEEENPELADMSRRFWVSTALALPVFLIAMVAELWPGICRPHSCRTLPSSGSNSCWRRRWCCGAVGRSSCAAGRSLVNRSLNMFTLIALGVGVAWIYSVVAARRAGNLSALGVPHARRGAGLLRGGGGDHRAGAAGPGAGAARPQPHQRRHQDCCWASRRRRRASCATTAAKRTSRWSRSSPATVCACAPARRCRWTAWCSKAPAHVDESMVTGEPIPVEKRAGDQAHRRHGERHRQPADAGRDRSAPRPCWRRSSRWWARRSAAAPRSRGWPTWSPATSSRRWW